MNAARTPKYNRKQEIEPKVLHNELTPTVVRSFRIAAQTQKNKDINFFVTGLITEDNSMAVCNIAKEIAVTLTYTSFKVRRFGKDNKH